MFPLPMEILSFFLGYNHSTNRKSIADEVSNAQHINKDEQEKIRMLIKKAKSKGRDLTDL